MEVNQRLMERYLALRGQQTFDPALLDYARLEAHKPQLRQLASLSNSAVTVFDMHAGEHAFASYNFGNMLGYDSARIAAEGNSYFDERVHPVDFWVMLGMGVQMLEFFYATPKEEWPDYKMVNEYRVLGREDRYVRIIEQHQMLETDPLGNLWLSMSMIDISPRQDEDRGVEAAILNRRTGKSVPLESLLLESRSNDRAVLSDREREVLTLIQNGHLSKEISDLLSISVHTVNTHRQRILQKLEVNNSMEAVQLANRLGLLG